MKSLLLLALLLSACSSSDGNSDMAVLGHHQECADGIGGSRGTCASGLVCIQVFPCVGTRLDSPGLCLLPNENYCEGIGMVDMATLQDANDLDAGSGD